MSRGTGKSQQRKVFSGLFTDYGRSTPRDLRDASPASAGAGKIYPVDPEALKLFRKIMAEKLAEEVEKSAQGESTMPTQTKNGTAPKIKFDEWRKRREGAADAPDNVAWPERVTKIDASDPIYVDLTKPLDPNEHYPQDAIDAARLTKTRLASNDLKRPNLTEIFTDAVVERWHELKQANPQMTNEWLAANNGLIEVSKMPVQRRLQQHKKKAKQQTAVSQPKPIKPAPVKTAVSQPAPIADTVNNSEPPTNATAVSEPIKQVADETAVSTIGQEPPNLPDWLRREPAPSRSALAELTALLNRDDVKVRGRVKLDIEVEFGQ